MAGEQTDVSGLTLTFGSPSKSVLQFLGFFDLLGTVSGDVGRFGQGFGKQFGRRIASIRIIHYDCRLFNGGGTHHRVGSILEQGMIEGLTGCVEDHYGCLDDAIGKQKDGHLTARLQSMRPFVGLWRDVVRGCRRYSHRVCHYLLSEFRLSRTAPHWTISSSSIRLFPGRAYGQELSLTLQSPYLR